MRGSLDKVVTARLLGNAEIKFGDPTTVQRGTAVEIWLDRKGRLLTVRRSWTQTPQGREDECFSRFHATPRQALEWLVTDGKGKLGPASKAAWVAACSAFSPMAGMHLADDDQPQTLPELLKGRSPLLCICGRELFVEEITTDDGHAARFIPCRCGSEAAIYVPPGSIVGSIGGINPLQVWGPPNR
jgi:hypothetical protein